MIETCKMNIKDLVFNCHKAISNNTNIINEIDCEINNIKGVLKTKISIAENTIIIYLRKSKKYDLICNEVDIIIKNALSNSQFIRSIVDITPDHILVPEITDSKLRLELTESQILDQKTKIIKNNIYNNSNILYKYNIYPSSKGDAVQIQF